MRFLDILIWAQWPYNLNVWCFWYLMVSVKVYVNVWSALIGCFDCLVLLYLNDVIGRMTQLLLSCRFSSPLERVGWRCVYDEMVTFLSVWHTRELQIRNFLFVVTSSDSRRMVACAQWTDDRTSFSLNSRFSKRMNSLWNVSQGSFEISLRVRFDVCYSCFQVRSLGKYLKEHRLQCEY